MLRRAGARWRILAHHLQEHSYSASDTAATGAALDHVTWPDTEFDELVVGKWIHLEQMGRGSWWMNVGGVTVWIDVDRDGRPKRVSVHGPGDYAGAEPNCEYSLNWSEGDES